MAETMGPLVEEMVEVAVVNTGKVTIIISTINKDKDEIDYKGVSLTSMIYKFWLYMIAVL